MQVTIILATLALLYQQVAPQTSVTVYEHSNFLGEQVDLEDIDEHEDGVFLRNFNDKTSSFKIQRGTCVQMPNHWRPTDDMFWTTAPDYSFVGADWNERISTVKRCGTYTRDVKCPAGSFVKKVSWDQDNMMTGGIQLDCSGSESQEETSTKVRTHGGRRLTAEKECPMVRGIQFTRYYKKDADIAMEPLCDEQQKGVHMVMCNGRLTLRGMMVEIERRSGFIKNIVQYYCTDLGRDRSALDVGIPANESSHFVLQIPQNGTGIPDY